MADNRALQPIVRKDTCRLSRYKICAYNQVRAVSQPLSLYCVDVQNTKRKKNKAGGDEVITVTAGFPTTVDPTMQNNCVPVFVNADSLTYNINTGLPSEAYSKKRTAVMISHTLGNQ